MAGARKIATGYVDGEPVIEFMAPHNALSEGSDVISQGLYLLSEEIIRGLLPDERGGGLGGEFGYGANFENDVFMMHRYCWCERDDCLWCHGCDCDPDRVTHLVDGKVVSSDEAWKFSEHLLGKMPHELYEYGTDEYKKYSAQWDERVKERDRRSKVIYPAVAHKCGHAMMADRERGEDWQPRQTAPHFWHKPSGLKIWWYKWIGRDMELVPGAATEWGPVFKECWDAIPQDTHASADAQRAHESTPEYKAAQEEAMRAMMAAMDKMFRDEDSVDS